MTTRRITEPQFLPVTLDQARLQCHIDDDNTTEDALLTEVIIPGAVELCQQLLQRSLMSQTWRMTRDTFDDLMTLPWGTVLSVTGIEYRDLAGNWQTLSTSTYETDLESLPARITLADGQLWPQLWNGTNVVRITYTAGFSAGNEAAQRAAVPASIKQWLLLTVGTAYAQRESLAAGMSVSELPGRFVDGLLDAHRVWGH